MHGVDDAVVGADEPVVVGELVLAVGRDERGAVGLVAGIPAEHREQRNADAGGPLLVGRTASRSSLLERVARRAQDELDGVDERAVEVEQDRGQSSCAASGRERRAWPFQKIAASMLRMASPTTPELKKLLLTLIVAIVVLDATVIGAYYAFHIADRAVKTQQTYVAVWVVLTLIVVTTLMKRIRQARRRR